MTTSTVTVQQIREFSCRVCSHSMLRAEAWITRPTPGGDVSYRCGQHKTPDCVRVA